MNKENMQKVIDHIKTHVDQFDMSTFGYGILKEPAPNLEKNICCTAACICGTTNVVSYNESSKKRNPDDDMLEFYCRLHDKREACAFLGISEDQGEALFYAGFGSLWEKYGKKLGFESSVVLLGDIESEHAITMLQNLKDEVWNFDRIGFEETDIDDEDGEEE